MSNQYTPSEVQQVSDSFYTNLPSLNINSLQSSQQTSSLSPDEMVIRSRGRRQFPNSFSPDRLPTTTTTSSKTGVMFSCHFSSNPRNKSPPKIVKPGLQTRNACMLSASPERIRRRLDLSPDDHQDFSILNLLPVIKKGMPQHGQDFLSGTDVLPSQSNKKLKISPRSSTTPFPCSWPRGSPSPSWLTC